VGNVFGPKANARKNANRQKLHISAGSHFHEPLKCDQEYNFQIQGCAQKFGTAS
jgi:hypothetical protein